MELIGLDAIASAAVAVFAMQPLLWLLAGVLLGFVFGASPGLTATTGVAIATPLTFGASFEASMSLLLGIYTSGYFAGSIPAILVNTPGAPGNAATALPGYRLARAGRADLAIGMAVCASGIGGLLSIMILMFAAPQLSSFALSFTSVEYFALGLFGLICVAAVSGGSIAKGIAAAAFGMMLGTVGIDEVSGETRFVPGMPELQGGVPLIPALIAFFAVAEIIAQAANSRTAPPLPPQHRQPVRALPRLLAGYRWLLLKSSLIGTFIGILPGTGPTIASWIAYGQSGAAEDDARQAQQAADTPRATDSALRGIAASESANNAVTGGALVPLLTLGIPGDTVTAVLIGALLIQGIDPGPFFIVEHPDLFAMILILLLLAGVLTVVIGLTARTVLPAILRIPERLLLPVIGVLCVSGTFAVGNSPFEVGLLVVLGVLGYALSRFGVPMAPVVIGLVLGPIIETNLRNGLNANDGDLSVFFTRPISALLLLAVVVTLLFAARRNFRRSR